MSSRLWREILIIWMLFAVSDLRARPEEDEPTIGVLFWHQSPNDFVAFEGIRSGFESAGREPTFFARQASSSEDAAHRILDEFRARRVDLVFAMGTQASLLAKERLEDIPIVFTAVTNPVESGVVPSWEGSKRNLAGNSNWIGPDKILPVFRMAVPRLSRLGVLRSEKAGLVSEAELRGVRDYLAAQEKPPVVIVEEVVAATDGIEDAVRRLDAAGVEAIWIPIDITIYENLELVRNVSDPLGIPLVSSSLRGAEAGAVAGVLVDYALLGQNAVVIALDILDGVRTPGEIPIGTMQGYQVIVNLTAARRCRYELPLAVLAVADRLIEPEGEGFR